MHLSQLLEVVGLDVELGQLDNVPLPLLGDFVSQAVLQIQLLIFQICIELPHVIHVVVQLVLVLLQSFEVVVAESIVVPGRHELLRVHPQQVLLPDIVVQTDVPRPLQGQG